MFRYQALARLGLLGLLLQTAGCEIAALAIVASDGSSEPPVDEPQSEFCSRFTQRAYFLDPAAVKTPGGSRLTTRGTLRSLSLATAESLILILERPELAAVSSDEVDSVSLEVDGAFAEVEWDRCGTRALGVVLHPTEIGKGTLRVVIYDKEVDAIDFRVAEATTMNLTMDLDKSIIEAHLLDEGGEELYGDEVIWDAAPLSSWFQSVGNLFSIPYGSSNETYVVAYHEALSASLTYSVDPLDGSVKVK